MAHGMIVDMALSTDDQAYFRSKLGSTIDVADLEERLTRLTAREAVVVEVLDQRIADLLSKPASFTVPGEYSEDRSANIRALTAMADETRMLIPAGGHTVRVVQPAYSPR